MYKQCQTSKVYMFLTDMYIMYILYTQEYILFCTLAHDPFCHKINK